MKKYINEIIITCKEIVRIKNIKSSLELGSEECNEFSEKMENLIRLLNEKHTGIIEYQLTNLSHITFSQNMIAENCSYLSFSGGGSLSAMFFIDFNQIPNNIYELFVVFPDYSYGYIKPASFNLKFK